MRPVLTSLALVIALGAAPSTVAQSLTVLPGEKARAEKAWPLFFKSFRASVTKRDRDAVREMMVRDFFFSGGGGDDNHDGDMRDEAFTFLDDPQVHGWQAFDKALAKGAVNSGLSFSGDGKKHYSRVAPPAARNRTSLAKATPWIAYFEFRDGRWYCTSFSQCCD